MKLTKEHIGQKFTQRDWRMFSEKEYRWFKPLGLSEDGKRWIGESNSGYGFDWESTFDDWLPYEPQPKQKVLMSPELELDRGNGDTRLIRPFFGRLQPDKPLRVALKNPLWIYPDGTMKTDDSVFEADLWIKVSEEE